MKQFAGISLEELNNTNILALQKHCKAIDLYLQNYINKMTCDNDDEQAAKLEFQNLYTMKNTSIKHLDNYLRLVGHIYRLPDACFATHKSAESLNALIDLLSKCAPSDWIIQSDVRTLELTVNQLQKAVCANEDVIDKLGVKLIQELEGYARQLFRAATDKNLEIAFDGLKAVYNLTAHLQHKENLDAVLGIQLCNYYRMKNYLATCGYDDPQTIAYEFNLNKCIADTIAALQNIPEQKAENPGCLRSLLLFYGCVKQKNVSQVASETTANKRNKARYFSCWL